MAVCAGAAAGQSGGGGAFVGPIPAALDGAAGAGEAAVAVVEAGAEASIPVAAGGPTDERRPLIPGAGGAVGGGGAPIDALGGESVDLTPTLLALVGVVGLIALVFGGLRLMRGGGGRGGLATARAPSGILEVLGRYPLGSGPTLLLLRVDRRVLLLSQARASRLSGSTLTALCELDDPDEVASILVQARDARDESISARFGALLGGFAAEHAGGDGQGFGARGGSLRALAHGGVEVSVVDAAGGEGLDEPAAPMARVARSSRLRERLEGMRAWEGVVA
ncbi:MAG: flagellar biosynthetic protein FliO [Phycisphaeraceae bacterium]|nr:flagellar biosynthetic protein FliO [Phycisphaeraceae bacterium]